MIDAIYKLLASVILLYLTIILWHHPSKINFAAIQHHSPNICTTSNSCVESGIIPQLAQTKSSHSATVIVLSNGDLLSAWFSGSKEGAMDVQIFTSLYHNSRWSDAKAILNRQLLERANESFIYKIGNPVLYQTADGIIHLFVVAVRIGGWAMSYIGQLQSTDRGESWQVLEPLVTQPLANVGTLLRSSAVRLKDNMFYLPAYYECMVKIPLLILLNKYNKVADITQITAKHQLLQPSIAVVDKNTAVAYFRNAALIMASFLHKQIITTPIMRATTLNAGRTWSSLQPSNLRNADSSLAVCTMKDHEYLMVYNPGDRDKLMLAVSQDGYQWRNIYTIAYQEKGEFSYPNIQCIAGVGIILYTNLRKNIKWLAFNQSWINQQIINP